MRAHDPKIRPGRIRAEFLGFGAGEDVDIAVSALARRAGVRRLRPDPDVARSEDLTPMSHDLET
jgi:hypothetical protein